MEFLGTCMQSCNRCTSGTFRDTYMHYCPGDIPGTSTLQITVSSLERSSYKCSVGR